MLRFEGSRASTTLFWGAALFALVMALIPHGVELPGRPNDKVQHAMAFATLVLLGGLAYPRKPALRMIAALSLFGACIEIAQAIPSLHRDSDPLDWVADTIACTLAIVAVRGWQSRRS
jgi:hypothetical protein